MRWRAVGACLLAAAAASAQSPTASPLNNALIPLSQLQPGDVVNVSVYGVPELTMKTKIDGNGNIYLPLISSVHLSGSSIDEAQTLIEKKLSDGGFVRDPHAAVSLEQQGAPGISLLGPVLKAGVYPATANMRLFDLLSEAGGLTDKAGNSATITRREDPSKPMTVELAKNLADLPASNVSVLPGDTVVIRRAPVVYVVGDVGRPSGFVMDNGQLTVLQAVALAGGTTHTSKLSGVRLIHKGPNGMTETEVKLQKILSAKAADIPMQADDILFVPSSATKVLASRTMEVAMQAATAVSIVAVQ